MRAHACLDKQDCTSLQRQAGVCRKGSMTLAARLQHAAVQLLVAAAVKVPRFSGRSLVKCHDSSSLGVKALQCRERQE